MHNLNYVSTQVEALAGPAARTVGLIDSGVRAPVSIQGPLGYEPSTLSTAPIR